MSKKLLVFVIGAVVGAGLYWAWGRNHGAAPAFDTPFQAVLLDTGQVYYGKIEGMNTDYPVLREVYYIQSTTDPKTQQVTNVLIRRGKEWHGPDYTVLNAKHIAMIEPVNPTSKVAGLIAEQERLPK